MIVLPLSCEPDGPPPSRVAIVDDHDHLTAQLLLYHAAHDTSVQAHQQCRVERPGWVALVSGEFCAGEHLESNLAGHTIDRHGYSRGPSDGVQPHREVLAGQDAPVSNQGVGSPGAQPAICGLANS